MRSDFFKCLLCESNSVRINDTAWVCEACGHAYPMEGDIPLLVRDWESTQDEIANAQNVLPNWYINEQPAEEVSAWRHHLKKRRLYVQDIIENHLRQKGVQKVERLLDIGCGDGNHLRYLENYGEHIYGSDYNLLRLTRAHKRYPDATFFLADILDYPSKENFFDIIFFHHVIEHIKEDVKALETIYRALKPGGLLVLGTPNEGAWWWQLAYKLQPEVLEVSDHVQFYTSDILEERMQRAGLTTLKTKHIGWGPPHWGLDYKIRRYKIVDDSFEFFGKLFFRKQSSSLYMIATKS